MGPHRPIIKNKVDKDKRKEVNINPKAVPVRKYPQLKNKQPKKRKKRKERM